jgi:DNA replication licensing factor MCM4
LGKIVEPAICDHCKQRRTLVLVHNRSSFDDKQYVKMQETPDSIPEGSTPQTVQLAVHGQLVDVAVPGDKVMVTGIYRASAIRPSGGQRNLKQIYKTCSSYP